MHPHFPWEESIQWRLMKQTKIKAPKTAHTSNSKKGMGDYYGTGIPNKIGKIRDGMGVPEVTPKKLKKPPKSLA